MSKQQPKITPKQGERFYEIIRQEDRQQLDRRLKQNFKAIDFMRRLQQASQDQGRDLVISPASYSAVTLDQEFCSVIEASNVFFEEYAETETPREAIWPVWANVGTHEHEDWRQIGWTAR